MILYFVKGELNSPELHVSQFDSVYFEFIYLCI